MRRAGYVHLVVALVLMSLAACVFLPMGAGPGALEREMAFDNELHNSLYHLDLAKWQWAEQKHKSERVVSSMDDLTPYLGDWTNAIGRLIALGVTFKITAISEMNPQSDVATLTHDVSFRRGFVRYYPAGTTYCLHTGWAHPQPAGTSWVLACYQNNRDLLAALLFIVGMGNVLVLLKRKILELKRASAVTCEHQTT